MTQPTAKFAPITKVKKCRIHRTLHHLFPDILAINMFAPNIIVLTNHKYFMDFRIFGHVQNTCEMWDASMKTPTGAAASSHRHPISLTLQPTPNPPQHSAELRGANNILTQFNLTHACVQQNLTC